ncbi:MAG: RNA polymerase sigma-70 factor [Tannerella sp.]|jgi:RNA polymerase sigma-70 factor (ECF subfamily)|nr:RNA polymerase sigma-70 factor [Tannerella sp.]
MSEESSFSEMNMAEAMRNGSKQAFETVYRKYHRMLYSIALHYLSSTEDAEDAVADVFVHLWEIRRDIVVETNLRNYLYTMVKNNILNRLRRSKPVFLSVDCEEAHQKEEESLEEFLDRKEMSDRLYGAINSLPEQKRKICLLKMEGNLTNEDIAERMNISLNTVKTHYLQSLRMLRVALCRLLTFVSALTLF